MRTRALLWLGLSWAAAQLQAEGLTGVTPSIVAATEQEKGEDLDHGALTFTDYDLEIHLEPSQGHMSAVARISLRNDGTRALQRIALDLSSSLQWEAISEREAGAAPSKLHFDQLRRDTDTDHTGAESEAIVTLARPLAPGATARLTTLYSGTIERSSARMERSGAPAADGERVDWDAITPDRTLLRGFGNVLWYPVASPPIFLGDGAKLAEEIGAQRRRQRETITRLRLQMEYTGKAPATAFFCGRMANLQVSGEPVAAGEAESGGIATADFAPAPLGFGSLSLFVVASSPEFDGRILGVVTGDPKASRGVEQEAAASQPLIREWLGPLRERAPVLLDHAGQPFAQGALLVESSEDAANPFAVLHLLSHAWFASDAVWLDEGVAQFLPIVAVERASGRAAARTILDDQRPALMLAESNAPRQGESLATASREVLYRNKAVAVLWMLRSQLGDETMKKALIALRSRPVAERGSKDFEGALEQASGKNLAWFFNDWVFEDKGLPDLSIVSAAARTNPARQGVSEGTLVAVEVRNEGAAAVEVPVTVRSGELTATESLRVPGNGVASTRILFQGRPQEVEVNDGSVPEATMERHIRSLKP